MLNIALAKGRLGEKTYSMMAAAGFDCPAILEKNRKLTFENVEKGVRYFWVKPSDVAIYVERGAADVGVCGKDILLEYEPDIYELLDLDIGKCRMCIAGPKGFYDNEERTLRVVTKFSNVAKKYYESIGRDIDIIKLNGSIEIAPLLGLSDVIFDIVETGNTLRENDLKVLQEVVPVSARLICNKISYQFKHDEIMRMRDGLETIVNSGDKVETIKLEH
ncbi:MAG: ATP phosphoribosyltransferase [Lachnospiraceae bacterium]|nr:ATP phosphoribosyltransferase [Lachnospiraceae bacterium]